MSANRPIYAFHVSGLDGRSSTPDRIEDLAAMFVRELLAVRPTGPYLLGGWSIGGTIAFEMALQLADLGHAVPTLILVDSTAPPSEKMKHDFGELTPARVAVAYVNNFARCFGIDLGIERSRFAGLADDQLAHAIFDELHRVPAFAPEIDPVRLGAHLAVFSAALRGYRDWRPRRPYGGRIAHLLARDGHPEFDSTRADWSQFLEHPVELSEVPGNHFSLMSEPHVAAVAAALDRVLASVP